MMRLFSVVICATVLTLSSCGKKLLPTSTIEKEYALEKFDFEYLQAKSKIRFSSPERNLTSTATIRMKKDSVIWISVTPVFGIEAARGFINSDTIVFLDRVNKDVYRYNYESLSRALNFEIDFALIQAIILGNQVFKFQGNDNFSKKSGELKIMQDRGRFALETVASSENRKVRKIKVKEVPDGSSMEIDFSQFDIVAEQIFAFKTNVAIKAKGVEELTEVEINHAKVEVGTTPISFPFSVSNKYEN